jgi:hypothetical protein
MAEQEPYRVPLITTSQLGSLFSLTLQGCDQWHPVIEYTVLAGRRTMLDEENSDELPDMAVAKTAAATNE